MNAAARPRPEARRPRAALALTLSLATLAHADDALHGRLELQDDEQFARAASLDAALGARDWNDQLANLRLIWEPQWSRWNLSVHYLVTFEHGEEVPIARAEAALLGAPPPTWLTLGNRFIDRGETQATQGFDRLALGYTTPDFVLRLGRQALTWGSGLVFRPMDLFDPFSPNATDTEYKPGTDMLYAQWLLGKGSDLQAVIVPRGAQPNASPAADQSSFALHLRTPVLGYTTPGCWHATTATGSQASASTARSAALPGTSSSCRPSRRAARRASRRSPT